MADVFDETMEDEIQEPEATEEEEAADEEQEVADETGDEETPTPGEEEAEPDLKSIVDELKKENKGLYSSMREQREKRQQLEAKLDQFTEMFRDARSRRTESSDDGGEPQTVKVGSKRITVQFDDEGNPYIDADALQPLTKPQIEKVENEILRTQEHQALLNMRAENERIISSVISQDANSYSPAWQNLNSAWRFLDESLTDIVNRKAIDTSTLNLDRAADILESDKETMENFQKKFPGIDVDTVFESLSPIMMNRQVNTRKLRKALNALRPSSSDEDTGKGEKKLKSLRSLAGKANNLSRAPNQRGSAGKTLDELAEISQDDFMRMSDADAARIERALAELEG